MTLFLSILNNGTKNYRPQNGSRQFVLDAKLPYHATYRNCKTNPINQCYLVAPISAHRIKHLSIHRDMHLTLILIHFHPCYHNPVIALLKKSLFFFFFSFFSFLFRGGRVRFRLFPFLFYDNQGINAGYARASQRYILFVHQTFVIRISHGSRNPGDKE